MLFQFIYDEDLAQASYLIGCQAAGEAIAVDPRRDVDTYLRLAEHHGLRLSAVTETHIHADYQSGSRELAERSGATLYLSDEGDADWKYGFPGEKLVHGSEIQLGKIRIQAVHTPGHTPEHLSFLVTDGAATDRPGFFLTGDFVFVGDVGRPDLLDEAAGFVDTRFGGARQLFASLRDHFLTLPDYVQVWPAHGAGSACGKALGAVPLTTVGYERQVGWWSRMVREGDLEGFTSALLEGQPDAPLYFGRMKRTNKLGPALLGQRPPLRAFNPAELRGRVNADLTLLDTRPVAEHRADHVPGALFVPEGKKFATNASFAVDPDADARPIVVLAQDQSQASWMRDRLAWTGIDNVVGYVPSLEGLTAGPLPLVTPGEPGPDPGRARAGRAHRQRASGRSNPRRHAARRGAPGLPGRPGSGRPARGGPLPEWQPGCRGGLDPAGSRADGCARTGRELSGLGRGRLSVGSG